MFNTFLTGALDVLCLWFLQQLTGQPLHIYVAITRLFYALLQQLLQYIS